MSVVLYCMEHLRDGREEWARVYPELKNALDEAGAILNRSPAGNRHNYTLRIFELGPEIPIECDVTTEPGPAVEKVKFKPKENESI